MAQIMATELIAQLHGLIGRHGDLPVAIRDDGAYPMDPPRFDSEGAGDDCFLV